MRFSSAAVLLAAVLASASPIAPRIDARELIHLPKGYATTSKFCSKLHSFCASYATSIHDKNKVTSSCSAGSAYDGSKGTALINCYSVDKTGKAQILTPGLIKHQKWKTA